MAGIAELFYLGFSCYSFDSNSFWLCNLARSLSVSMRWFRLRVWTLEIERMLPVRLNRPTSSIMRAPDWARSLLALYCMFFYWRTFAIELELRPAVAEDRQSLTPVFLSIVFLEGLCQAGSYLICGPIIM